MRALRYICAICISFCGCNDNRQNSLAIPAKADVKEAVTGSVQFWQDGEPAYGITSVIISNHAEQISRDMSKGSPGCNTNGCANFTLPEGRYYYSAEEAFPGTARWMGTINIKKDSCLNVELY